MLGMVRRGRGTVSSRSHRAKAAVGALAAFGLGLSGFAVAPAQALQIGSVASVSPHDTIAGTQSGAITVSVYSDTGPVDAVRIVRPTADFSIVGGSAPNWTATTSPDGYETFTGFALAPAQTGKFVVDIATAQPAADEFGNWTVLTSSDGGNTYTVAQGAQHSVSSLSGNIRVLSMTEPVISPVENGNQVTSGEQVTVSTTVTNHGSGTITLDPSACSVTGDETGDVTAPGTYVGSPATLSPGQSAVVELSGVTIGTNVGSPRYLRTTISTGDGTALQAAVNEVTIAAPAPYIQSAATGYNGTYFTINLQMSTKITGTYNVNNWRVVDNQGVAHPVFNMSGSGGSFWVLELTNSPPFTAGWTATVTYTPGDLHDSNGTALPQTTIQASSGTPYGSA